MIELNKRVIGEIKAREIFGSIPSAPDTQEMLKVELDRLLQEVEAKTKGELIQIINTQKELERQVNSRPGAMALPQSKIKLYVDYNHRYIDAVKAKIKNSS